MPLESTVELQKKGPSKKETSSDKGHSRNVPKVAIPILFETSKKRTFPLSAMDTMVGPKLSFAQRFHCTTELQKDHAQVTHEPPEFELNGWYLISHFSLLSGYSIRLEHILLGHS